jgi:hypothetical protein
LREDDNTLRLRQFVDVMLQVPYVCLVPSALTVLPSLITLHYFSRWAVVCAIAVLVGPLLARVWYQSHPRSMNAFFLLNSIGALSLTAGLLSAMWEMRRLSRLGWLYTDYVSLYVISFIGLGAGTAIIVFSKSDTLKRKFEYLKDRLSEGFITDDQLWYWTSPAGASVDQLKWRIRSFSGVAVFGTLASGFLGGKAGLGYFYFLISLLLVAVALGLAIARFWAHWKYLRFQDLRILNG